LFAKAVEKDPEYGAAYAMLAWMYTLEQAVTGIALSPTQRSEAVRLANEAARLAPDDAFALARAGHVLTYLGRDYDRGASMTSEAVALNPNLAMAWYSHGWVALMCGDGEQAVESIDRMLRLSPLDPLRGSAWNGRAFGLFCLGRFVEGCESAKKSCQFYADAHTLGALIINFIGADRLTEAREAAARLLKRQPDFRASSSIDAFPMRTPVIRDRIIEALKAAGLPA
jgi:adenylate cyclase